MEHEAVASVRLQRWTGTEVVERDDELVVEAPLEIRLDGHVVTTTMRTPGHDDELAVGFCHADGLLAGVAVEAVRVTPGQAAGPEAAGSVDVVDVDTGGLAAEPRARLAPVSSSCGLCGTAEIDQLLTRLDPLPGHAPWPIELLGAMPERVAGDQELFARTGAVHAAASFDREGRVQVVREDIGRHNAVDAVVGRLRLDGELPASDRGLFVSGRASFEMVQKAWAAGFEAVVAVSAPSALAVETARVAGLTLAGFSRGPALNLYTS